MSIPTYIKQTLEKTTRNKETIPVVRQHIQKSLIPVWNFIDFDNKVKLKNFVLEMFQRTIDMKQEGKRDFQGNIIGVKDPVLFIGKDLGNWSCGVISKVMPKTVQIAYINNQGYEEIITKTHDQVIRDL